MKLFLVSLVITLIPMTSLANCSLTLHRNQLGEAEDRVSSKALQALSAKGYQVSYDENRRVSHSLLVYGQCSSFFFYKSCTYAVQVGTYMLAGIAFGNPVQESTVTKAIYKLPPCFY